MSPVDGPSDNPGRYAYDGLDRLLHEKARLGIMTSLITHAGGLAFNDLKSVCALTDGNLSRHLQALARAGLVEIDKIHDGGRPQTLCRVTSLGRRRFLEYLEELERVIRDVTHEAPSTASSLASRLLDDSSATGWVPA